VNDTLDTSTIADQAGSTIINVTLLGNPRLSPGGTYSSGNLVLGAPTGLYINNGIHVLDAANNTALNQTVPTAIDLNPGNVVLGIAWDDLTITTRIWNISTGNFGSTINAAPSFPPAGLIVRNIGNVRVQITVSCSATTAPSGWTLGATAGTSIFETKLVDGALVQDLSTGPKILVSGMYSGFQKPFDIRFVAPTDIPDVDFDVTQTFSILLVATQN
jgi:hypothetical protein